jgi:hypothetical protein
MKMQISIPQFDPDYLVYAGAVGIFLGLVFFAYFIYRRMRWIIGTISKKNGGSIRFLASLRNLLIIAVWTSFFGMALFLGFFLRAYHAFTAEEPVAEIVVQSLGQVSRGSMMLIDFFCAQTQKRRHLFIQGDQWMIEGDILKWDNWLNFLGLHTRYRLTRLRGRYLTAQAEVSQPQTIYSLVEDENDVFWRYLYRYGPRFPFVSTVYGNAAYQGSEVNRYYLVFVGTSGFVVREKEKK